MKDKIICESVNSLRREGLKFSVDTLAEKLKISKKTVYKYFPDKEALALALYDKYYTDAVRSAKALINSKSQTVPLDLLLLYFDSKSMTRRDIFNKYKLNGKVYSHTAAQNDELWGVISGYLGRTSGQDMEIFRIIVDGSFEKLCNDGLMPDAVAERLVQLL